MHTRLKHLLTLLTFSLLTVLTGCTTTPTQPANGDCIEMQHQSNPQATKTLVSALREQGYEVKQVSPAQFILFFDQHTFIMEPKINQGGLSRIVVSRVVGIKPKFRDSIALQDMTITLNQNLNFAKFSLMDGNKAGQVQTSITFINERINTEEIKQFMLWMDASLGQVRKMVSPKILNMIETPKTPDQAD